MKFTTAIAVCATALTLALPSANAQSVTLHLGHNNQTDHPSHIAGEEFARLVNEGTNGEIEVIVYPSEQLAALRDGAEGVQLGTIDLYYVDSGTLGNWHPEYSFVSLPFLFSDFDHAVTSMDQISDEITDHMRSDFNVERLGWTPAGFRVILTKDVMVSAASDLAGVKMRVPEIPLYIDTFVNVGANATPLPWGDVYSALQTGVIEGVEGPPSAIRAAGLHEVTTHAAPTRHIMTDLSLLMNLDRFNSLSAEQQEVVRNAGKQAFEETFRKLMKEADASAYGSIVGNLSEPENLDVGSFRTSVTPVVDAFIADADEKVANWISVIQSR